MTERQTGRSHPAAAGEGPQVLGMTSVSQATVTPRMTPLSVLVLAAALLSAQAKKVDLQMPPPPGAKAKPAAPPPAAVQKDVQKEEPIKLAMPGLTSAGVDANIGDF